LKLELDLVVIECEGWRRGDFWDATGLTWINPSPNMRSLTQAVLYPGVGLLETTNVSVGRGTDTPFEVLGAPWLDGRALARELNARGIPGVRFVPIEFTPTSSKFANEKCGGVNLSVTDRGRLEPVRIGIELAVALRKLYPEAWETKSFNRLLGNKAVFDAVLAGQTVEEVQTIARQGLPQFQTRREKFLLYE
jgi:uncharacterized protein YbbC (DUF1343 family)